MTTCWVLFLMTLEKTRPSCQQPERQCRSSQFISCDSAVGKHLLSNKSYAETYSDGNFIILYKCRSTFKLKVMEAICIKLNDPDLCRQKEFVFQLVLFWPSCIPLDRCHQFRDYISRWFFSWVSRRIALNKWSAEMHRALSQFFRSYLYVVFYLFRFHTVLLRTKRSNSPW